MGIESPTGCGRPARRGSSEGPADRSLDMRKRMLVAAAVVATLVVAQGITSAASLKFSGETSKIEFVGTKPANRGKHDGGFKTFTGTIDLPGTDFTQAKVSVEIQADSIYSDTPKLTQHLKTPDFFDVRTY